MVTGLIAVTLVGFSPSDPPEPWGERKSKPDLKPPTQEQFYQMYRVSGLPLPPRDAKLVKDGWKVLEISPMGQRSLSGQDHLSILVRQKSAGLPALLLHGWDLREESSDSRLRTVAPTAEAYEGCSWAT